MSPIRELRSGLRYGPLHDALHVCVDMQRLFEPGAPWGTPWIEPIRPSVLRLASVRPADTVFTRFMPPMRVAQAQGAWQRFYERWPGITLEQANPVWFELLPELAALTSTATVIDKATYSPFGTASFDTLLAIRRPQVLVLSGTETDVCVLATTLAAVDRGYRVVLAHDAVCSSKDRTHDALMRVYHERFTAQIETAAVAEILDHWVPAIGR